MNTFINPFRIGLSISFCVRDIAAHLVDINDVEVIIAGTCVILPESWCEVVARYKEVYWREFPKDAEEIFYQLLNSDRIEQPRLRDDAACPFVGSRHWVSSPEEIEWC